MISPNQTEILLIGGGVIGLSIAYELSKRDRQVVLLEREKLGRQASWAGAGILPPANAETAIHPLEKLEALSSQLHPDWAAELQEQTGIETGFQRCGGLYVARTSGEVASLTGQMLYWSERQIEYEEIDPKHLTTLAPGLAVAELKKVIWVPSEFQTRNPWHLQALTAACQQNGVRLVEDCAEVELIVSDNRTQCVKAAGHSWSAERYCVAAGAWSEQVLAPFGVPLPTTPVRGQLALFQLAKPSFQPVINDGSRYLVPRRDGHVLAGATVEEVGFNNSTVESDIVELKSWAQLLVPALNDTTFVTAWAGLRPGTYDGFPYLGPITSSPNTYVATGHLKSGLHLSVGTAIVMADLLAGDSPSIDLTPFSPSRAEYHLA